MVRLTVLGAVCGASNLNLSGIDLPAVVLIEARELAVMIDDAPALAAIEARLSSTTEAVTPERNIQSVTPYTRGAPDETWDCYDGKRRANALRVVPGITEAMPMAFELSELVGPFNADSRPVQLLPQAIADTTAFGLGEHEP